ncbi:CgeB family protein [Neomicrococcus aestuarii]|uniref:Spore protein YkvP/CgeB glycosyl transferase-like domain-containing protein n=1 Tax=Neomicrococcus aestuarii TaxID=556325 RepID=A0A1L2ZMM6_9MICC|nr:glycosyltransferase [Neomicrococcus aestuarii]APF40467.1 hypothetical protein BHE16_04900 [Neomicrococcus aestuarii]
MTTRAHAEHKGTLLLVTPTFHGYYRSIADALEQRGYSVVSHRYDAFDSLQAKLRNKLLHELPAKVGMDHLSKAEDWSTRRALQALKDVNPDFLVVIKGDALGEDFWSEVEKRQLPRILWLYDDLKRHSYSIDFLKNIGPVLSYSKDETDQLTALGVNASYLPNAFDPNLAEPPTQRRQEIVFVGARYDNRQLLLETLRDSGVPVRAYGRQWSHHAIDKLRTWELSRPQIPAERDIPLADAYQVQAIAAAAINVHGLQAGLAMRTFEVPGMGGLQLVDRPDVDRFYDIGTEVLLFQSAEELVDLSRRALKDQIWAESIRAAGRKRTLAEHTFVHRIEDLDRRWE